MIAGCQQVEAGALSRGSQVEQLWRGELFMSQHEAHHAFVKRAGIHLLWLIVCR